MIFQLIYTCALAPSTQPEDLREIANHAAKRNERRGVTGVLLCKDGSVLQVLEGERDVVENLYELIMKDTRVSSPLVLLRRTATQREFPKWSMGFRDAEYTQAAFELCSASIVEAMPSDPTPEVRTIGRTFARVNGLAYA
jgi:acylphosphatase